MLRAKGQKTSSWRATFVLATVVLTVLALPADSSAQGASFHHQVMDSGKGQALSPQVINKPPAEFTTQIISPLHPTVTGQGAGKGGFERQIVKFPEGDGLKSQIVGPQKESSEFSTQIIKLPKKEELTRQVVPPGASGSSSTAPRSPVVPSPPIAAPRAGSGSAPQRMSTYEDLVHITYGEINRHLVPQAQRALDQALGQQCYTGSQRVGPYSAQYKSTYRCGEVPVGKVSGSSKILVPVPLPRGKVLAGITPGLGLAKPGEPEAGRIVMRDSFRLEVLLDRAQTSSRRKEPLLDTKGATGLDVKSTVGDTLTIRHTPRNGALFSLVCGYLPGLKVRTSSNAFNVDANYRWRFLFISGNERITVINDIRDASASMQSAKLCGVAKTSLARNQSGTLEPKIELIDITYPTFEGLKVNGPGVAKTRVVIHTLGAKIVDFVLRVFGRTSIEKMIADELQKAVKEQLNPLIKLHVNQVKTGEAFEQIIRDELGRTMSKNIVQSFGRAINTQTETLEVKFTEDIARGCQEAVSGYLRGLDYLPVANYIRQVCRDLKLDVALQPFVAHAPYAQKGCYNYPFSPLAYTASGKNTWWQNGCALSTKLKVTAPAEYIDLIKCLGSATTTASRLKCAEGLLEEIFGIPPEILALLEDVSSLEDLMDYARAYGYTAEEAQRVGYTLSQLIRL